MHPPSWINIHVYISFVVWYIPCSSFAGKIYPCGAGLIVIVFVEVPRFARDVVLLKIPSFPPLYDRRRVII